MEQSEQLFYFRERRMLLGEYQHTLDTKGRVTIPAKLRGELAAGLVVTRGFDQNLVAYPLSEWEVIATKIMQQPISDRNSRDFRRRFFANATDLVPDRQGRILLPANLREFAGIGTDVVITGMFDHIELWSKELWTAVHDDVANNDDAARWQGLGI